MVKKLTRVDKKPTLKQMFAHHKAMLSLIRVADEPELRQATRKKARRHRNKIRRRGVRLVQDFCN